MTIGSQKSSECGDIYNTFSCQSYFHFLLEERPFSCQFSNSDADASKIIPHSGTFSRWSFRSLLCSCVLCPPPSPPPPCSSHLGMREAAQRVVDLQADSEPDVTPSSSFLSTGVAILLYEWQSCSPSNPIPPTRTMDNEIPHQLMCVDYQDSVGLATHTLLSIHFGFCQARLNKKTRINYP